ncbi:MAG: metallophosphoesterase family protein [Pseudomonadota bacterium]
MAQHRIGVIADTHGLLRREALKALRGVELIIHAGDVGGPEILEALRALAPVYAVRGNTDRGDFGRSLPQTQVVQVGGVQLYVLHELFCLDLDPAAAGLAAVIFGHSHRPHLERKDGVLYLNPGSAGPRRFTLPVTLALLNLQKKGLVPKFIELSK